MEEDKASLEDLPQYYNDILEAIEEAKESSIYELNADSLEYITLALENQYSPFSYIGEYFFPADYEPRPYRSKRFLEYLHAELCMTREEIADYCDVTKGTITKYFKENDVKIRKDIGELGESYGFHSARQEIIEKDGVCVVCGMNNDECKDEFDKELDAHHVIPQKHFDEPHLCNSQDNLVALCPSCHKAHEGRTPRWLFKRCFSH